MNLGVDMKIVYQQEELTIMAVHVKKEEQEENHAKQEKLVKPASLNIVDLSEWIHTAYPSV